MKKRILSLLLVLSLLLAGCGGSSQPPAGSIKPADPAPATQPPVIEAPAETAPIKEKPVSLGKMDGGIYENAYAGYGCSLGSGWVYKSAEELQDISALTEDLLEGSEIDLSESNLSQVTDMMAENVDLLASMNVLYQQITPQEKLAYSVMGEEQIIDSILQSKDVLISSYSQAGIDVSTIEKVPVPFLGEARYAIHTSASVQGTPYYILQLFDYKLGGDYAVILTTASFVEDSTFDLLDLFYPV